MRLEVSHGTIYILLRPEYVKNVISQQVRNDQFCNILLTHHQTNWPILDFSENVAISLQKVFRRIE